MKNYFLMIILLFFMNGALNAGQWKTIQFATEATYPPFEFIDPSGRITGFDIEIASALCQQMKVDCTFSNQSFNSLIPSLKLGKFDAIIAALGVTEEREKEVSFTHAYYEPSGSFVGAMPASFSLSQLTGKVIGVQQGSVFEKYLRDKYGVSVKIKTYASVQDAFLDLVLGRLDAVLADTPIATAWLKRNEDNQFGLIGKPVVDHAYFGTGYAIAVRKGDAELRDAFNKALAEIKANGTYEKIAKKYFGRAIH
ncbi:transporter substrate-binding domain-containing protein [Aquicella lusitana]|uniref:Amino acid ABC transporter substrate-binding protein (PAAT family) n=2 Tax=Aquicella lusitana TaxID=254246 RepID=A0A370GH34_9COXI|nr:transporter substrate-binding domain-containing protein [Aquicella lusitana]RDI42556.1 amino acid ABC transporter substrate-binding protein (PAAT family) [Aquicella lusitana]VVC74335.1 Putative ABC transporter arginine-binding protein 2 [Aquicella lusitana]